MEQRKHVRIGNIAAGSWRQSRFFPYFVTFGRHADEKVEQMPQMWLLSGSGRRKYLR